MFFDSATSFETERISILVELLSNPTASKASGILLMFAHLMTPDAWLHAEGIYTETSRRR